MDLLRSIFQKSAPRGLFSFVFPQTPAGLQNPEYLKAYRGWVYACTKRIATSVATMELTLQEKVGGEWKDAASGVNLPALDLLTTVNPFLTSDALYRATSSYLDLTGSAFWYIAWNKRQPAEIWLLDPTKMEVVRDANNYISHWIYTNPAGKKIKMGTNEVIPFQDFNPEDPFKGKGPTEGAAIAIDQDRYASEWNRNFFANAAIPAMVLKTEQNLTQDQYDRLIEGWKAKYQGVQKAHQATVLEGGLEVDIISKTQKDMDFAGLRATARDEILAIFGVPKSVLGIVEDVNRANAEASEYVFAKYTIAPRMRFLATTLTEFYLPLWNLSPTRYRLYAADCVPRNDELDIKRKESGLNHGYYTINEIRAEEGLKPVPDGDTVLVPGTLKPLDLVLNPPEPLPMPGQPGAGGGDKDPKKAKSVTKSAEDERVAFIEQAIAAAAPKFEAIYTDQAKQLVTKMESQKGIKTAGKKDIDETERSNELVRFLFADWSDWIGVLLNPTRDTLEASFDEAGRQALIQLDLEQTFDLEHARAISWLETNALSHATSIADTVKGEVSNLIGKAVKDGKGAEDIAADISGYFTSGTEWKALRIARTEVIAGYAQGSLEGYKQSGIVNRKQWLTAGDSAVDGGDATGPCVINGKQGPILLDLNFESGHTAPPTHPSCRCVLQPVVDNA